MGLDGSGDCGGVMRIVHMVVCWWIVVCGAVGECLVEFGWEVV